MVPAVVLLASSPAHAVRTVCSAACTPARRLPRAGALFRPVVPLVGSDGSGLDDQQSDKTFQASHAVTPSRYRQTRTTVLNRPVSQSRATVSHPGLSSSTGSPQATCGRRTAALGLVYQSGPC